MFYLRLNGVCCEFGDQVVLFYGWWFCWLLVVVVVVGVGWGVVVGVVIGGIVVDWYGFFFLF